MWELAKLNCKKTGDSVTLFVRSSVKLFPVYMAGLCSAFCVWGGDENLDNSKVKGRDSHPESMHELLPDFKDFLAFTFSVWQQSMKQVSLYTHTHIINPNHTPTFSVLTGRQTRDAWIMRMTWVCTGMCVRKGMIEKCCDIWNWFHN